MGLMILICVFKLALMNFWSPKLHKCFHLLVNERMGSDFKIKFKVDNFLYNVNTLLDFIFVVYILTEEYNNLFKYIFKTNALIQGLFSPFLLVKLILYTLIISFRDPEKFDEILIRSYKKSVIHLSSKPIKFQV